MTVSWMDPHTTGKESRSCADCHTDPKSLGLGSGSLAKQNGAWQFTAATSQGMEGLHNLPRLDGFVNISGKRLVHTSRKDLRTFNKTEIEKILDAGRCLCCHQNFDDRVMKNWNPLSPPGPCRFFFLPR